MAISYVNAGTGNAGTNGNTITPSFPTSPVSGNLLLNVVMCKFATRSINTETGWTARGNTSGGAGTDGTTDEGQVRIGCFTKEATGAESGTMNQTFSSGTPNMSFARMVQFSRGGSSWNIGTAATAAVNAGGSTSLSFVFNTDPGISSGDVLAVAVALNTDNYTISSPAVSASGCTITGHATSTAFSSGQTEGSDARLALYLFDCTSGTSSGVATFTCTTSGNATNNPAGAAILLRLRQDGAGGSTIAPISSGYHLRGFNR